MAANEAFARAKIDALLKDVGWKLTDGHSVSFEMVLSDGLRADYVLNDRHGRALAVVEAKRASRNPAEAAAQGREYAVRGVLFACDQGADGYIAPACEGVPPLRPFGHAGMRRDGRVVEGARLESV